MCRKRLVSERVRVVMVLGVQCEDGDGARCAVRGEMVVREG